MYTFPAILAQNPPPSAGGPNAATIFYITLGFIFLTAIITTVATKWAKDKCLQFFHGFHVTLERTRGQTTWGRLKVFSSGIEIVFDHPYVDHRGQKKTSYLVYQHEIDQQLLTVFRYHDELEPAEQEARRKQSKKTFNPGPVRRFRRGLRNVINTLRDAFNAAIGTIVGQYQRMNPGSLVMSTQSQNVTAIGQTLLGRLANAYEPLLEQYIGRQVILDVADPINPNNATVQYAGYLADYTQQFVAVFNVEHKTAEQVELVMPDVDRGDPLPPLPPPPPPNAPPPVLPPPLKLEHELAVRLDGPRVKIMNLRNKPVVVRTLQRPGYEPLEMGMVIPPNGTLDLPARDTRGGTLKVDVVRCLDVVAQRKFATVRHAGELHERRGLADELYLTRLPLVPLVLGRDNGNGKRDGSSEVDGKSKAPAEVRNR
ncbi:MAG TPA: hypothetical protein VFB66_06090 [Tepidisphaeraceae bacterium]|nr:hypothetical protein [Tepidisphaeraceae bacterium]